MREVEGMANERGEDEGLKRQIRHIHLRRKNKETYINVDRVTNESRPGGPIVVHW